jgi:hypothetical protein
VSREPAHQRPGARVRYNYTDGPVPAGTLGTILGFLGRSQQAQIRWDDESVSAHTPDEYDVVPRGARRAVGEARRGKKTFETYASEVEQALVASGVRPGEAFVWISNHGSFIDQNFKRGIPSAETAERILEFERHSAIPWVDEARRHQQPHRRYTDDQVREMLKNASMWSEQLRVAAKERGFEFTSVTPISEILAFLRGGRIVGETRRTVHAAPTSGWTSGKRPSHAEIWADGKPIIVARSGRKWTVTVIGRPVVNGPSGGLTFEGRADYVDGLAPARFNSKGDADYVAHKIGRYMLNLGDFVHTYVEYVG